MVLRMNCFIKTCYCLFALAFPAFNNLASAQSVQSLELAFSKNAGVAAVAINVEENERIKLTERQPLFSVLLDSTLYFSSSVKSLKPDSTIALIPGVECRISMEEKKRGGTRYLLRFTNHRTDKIRLENIVPLGQTSDKTYITGKGPWALARAFLFRKGKRPVSVMLPDNAWEMGYAATGLVNGTSLCAIARRRSGENAELKRYWSVIKPGGTVTYSLDFDVFSGEWQNGLKMMFQKKHLYDLDQFNNQLFDREDLQWIRHKYIIALQFAWDKNFYDREAHAFTLPAYLKEGKRLFGGFDVFGLWPTWPTLGLDERNQFDLFSQLPGGLGALKVLMDDAEKDGTHFFICYNPWDASTREEDHYKALSRLIEKTDADGVVLDTRGSSSLKFQQAADIVKPGVVMYSEGMAIPKDMPGIVAGRVHDAIFKQPVLNLNKLIKPEFAIFRVLQLSQGRLHRELALSFFNGYGNEINTFAPGRPDWMEEAFLYLGRLTRILRENTTAFTNKKWRPLIGTTSDSIWVNQWFAPGKTLYTIFSLKPAGHSGPLFKVENDARFHFVDLLAHEEISPDTIGNELYLTAKIDAFNRDWLGTRREGNAGCIAGFRQQLQVEIKSDSLFFGADVGDSILVWAGNPGYQKQPVRFSTGHQRVKLFDHFGDVAGKFVVQLFAENELLDERVVSLKPGEPRLISTVKRTERVGAAPPGMVEIPAGAFYFKATQSASFIPYPDFSKPSRVKVSRFFMDTYPVTNAQFKVFVEATQYVPSDTAGFLKQWRFQEFAEIAAHPVTHVSHEDAKAYAAWSGKRLPTQVEWQFAAQPDTTADWPWGAEFDSTRCNAVSGERMPVTTFSSGKNRYGLFDLVGNVWQMTNDLFENGSYQFVILKGGSYFKPTSSWWYVEGGPQPVHKQQMLLKVSPGFERNATVGFRCVKDAE